MASLTLKEGKAPIIGDGKSLGCNIHINDSTDLFVLLFESAIPERAGAWGSDAYNIAENGEHCWAEVAEAIARAAADRGYIAEPSTQEYDPKAAQELAGFDAVSWGLNVRCRARRAQALLDWEPKGSSLEENLPGIVDEEWHRLQEVRK
jgi:nucleoside-diphosphate-sugar epimerase